MDELSIFKLWNEYGKPAVKKYGDHFFMNMKTCIDFLDEVKS